MAEPDFQVSYSSFRCFVECRGQQATHCISHDQYIRPASARSRCYSKEDSYLLFCDYCLAFWWRCRENNDQITWNTALFFRDQFEGAQASKLFDTPLLTFRA
jgi:hypothetical protein